MTSASRDPAPARAISPALPAFRSLAGIKVLAIALPPRILEASRTTPDNFALRVLSGAISHDDLSSATSPHQLDQRFRSHQGGAADDISIHLTLDHDELVLWELDPTEAILGYYPESLSDLPNVQHNQGKFGATIVDFRVFRDDIEAGVAMLGEITPSIGEIVAILPRALLQRYETRTRSLLPSNPNRAVPVRMLDGLALIFAQEGRSADQRFAADNEKAAWCEALDLVSLSGRLALTTRSQRIAGVKGVVMRAHYHLAARSTLYHRISTRVLRGQVFSGTIQRIMRGIEYARWRYFRG